MPDNVSTCICSRYRRAFAFSSIPFLYCCRFSLRITFLDFVLGAIQGFQAQHREVYWVRHTLSTERKYWSRSCKGESTSFLFYLLALVYQPFSLVTADDLYYAFTLHLPYQLSSTHPVMVTRRIFFSRFLSRIEILRYIVGPALYSGS